MVGFAYHMCRGIHLAQLFLRDAQTGHVAPVEVHFSAEDGVYVLGKGSHQIRLPGLDHAQGEDPGVIKEVEVVLQHVVLEFFYIQAAVADAGDEGVVQAVLPDGRGCAVQAVPKRHLIPPPECTGSANQRGGS